MARPSKYTDERRAVIVQGLEAGLTRTAAAARAEVDLITLTTWCRRYPAFSAQCSIAESKAEARFTAVIAQAAAAHDVTETKVTQGPNGDTVVTTTRREFDWRAAESWLKRRRREEWGDKQEIEQGGTTKHEHYHHGADEEAILAAADKIKSDRERLPSLT